MSAWCPSKGNEAEQRGYETSPNVTTVERVDASYLVGRFDESASSLLPAAMESFHQSNKAPGQRVDTESPRVTNSYHHHQILRSGRAWVAARAATTRAAGAIASSFFMLRLHAISDSGSGSGIGVPLCLPRWDTDPSVCIIASNQLVSSPARLGSAFNTAIQAFCLASVRRSSQIVTALKLASPGVDNNHRR